MWKINSLKTFLLVCVFTLSVPLFAFAEEAEEPDNVVVPYGPGEWDYMGQENVAFAYTKETITDNYYAVDGGNFKIDITSTLYPSNVVSAEIYVNGNFGGTQYAVVNNGKGTLEFSGLPVGARLWFHIRVVDYDTLNFKFYD